jgi:hypothetical protein
MNYPLIISAASALIAASAFLLAWLNYRTHRKMPNENTLFEEKFKSYRLVIAELNTVAAVYVECANEFYDLKSSGQALRKAKDELNDELAKAYYLMEDTVHEQTLVLPDEVLECIDEYFDLFNQEDFLEDTAKARKTDQFEERLNELFDAVINAMREDLAFEKLDKGLKLRLGGRQRDKSIHNTKHTES